jgi:hypothetical protein
MGASASAMSEHNTAGAVRPLVRCTTPAIHWITTDMVQKMGLDQT